MQDERTKHCPKCGIDKPHGEFSPCKRGRDRLASWCRACYRERYHADKPPCPKCGTPMVARAKRCNACRRADDARRTCKRAGCPRRQSAKGYCAMHYARVRKHGDPGPVGPLKPLSAPRGSGYVTKAGYRRVYRDGREQLEHRVVMEDHYGRPLLPTESVHHRNGNRADNRIANLELWVTPQRSGQRVEDHIAFFVEHYPEAVKSALKGREA